MTSAAIWIGLAVIAVIAFVGLVLWWGRSTPSTDDHTTPSQPPAGPGADGA